MLQLGQVRQSLARLQEAEAVAERLSDDGRLGRVCAFMTNLFTLLGESDKAIAAGMRATTIAQRLGDLGMRLVATSYLAQQYINRGEFQRASELAAENLATLPPDALEERLGGLSAPLSIIDLTWLAASLMFLGRFEEASKFAEEGIRLAERAERPFMVSFSYATKGYLCAYRGDWAKARSALQHALTVAHTGNVVVLRSVEIAAYGWALAYLGEATEAENCLQEASRIQEIRRTQGIPSGTAGPIDSWLGEGYLALGRLAEAQRCAEGLLEATHIGYARPLGLYLLAQLEAHPDRSDAEKSEDYYRQALLLFAHLGMRPLLAHCHLGLGKLYRRTDKREQAQEHLTTATTMYRDMGLTYWLEQAETNMKEPM
jgi:tetratricopeptide (TPR) repeat protein